MTTKSAGGKVTGILALTLEGQEALAIGDPVHITGDYECEKADGTKPVVGYVSVANVKRSTTTGFYPTANVPGDVTVEAFGWSVRTFVSGGAITAGTKVGVSATSKLEAADGTNDVGIALTGAAGVDEDVDVLCTGAPGFATQLRRWALNIPLKLANVADGDVVTDLPLGFAGQIVDFKFLVTDPVTTAAKTSALHLEIGAVALTGGVLTITSATATPLGEVIEATAITAGDVFDDNDTLSVVAASTTAFVEGEGILVIVVES